MAVKEFSYYAGQDSADKYTHLPNGKEVLPNIDEYTRVHATDLITGEVEVEAIKTYDHYADKIRHDPLDAHAYTLKASFDTSAFEMAVDRYQEFLGLLRKEHSTDLAQEYDLVGLFNHKAETLGLAKLTDSQIRSAQQAAYTMARVLADSVDFDDIETEYGKALGLVIQCQLSFVSCRS